MPIYRDKKKGCFCFEFDRIVQGQRVRTRKQLPRTWNQAQADAFDRQESARLYALAAGVERPSFTIEDAVSKYLTERIPQLKHGLDYAQALALMFPYYQGRPIESLPDVCKAYRLRATREEHFDENGDLKPSKPLAPATIKNRIRYLTAACRYGWKHHNMCDADPAAKVTVPTVKNARQVFIPRADMIKVAKACKDRPVRAMIRIAFYSGMRLSEIIRARVEGDNFVLADTKNGDPRHVPVHPKVLRCTKYKWPSRYMAAYHFEDARKSVGMEWLHFHDLRHSAASAMIQSGVDLYTVGAVLGHRSSASTKRYAHLATDGLKQAIGKIGKKVA